MYRLIMNWNYEYDKEGTWFDCDSGKECLEAVEGASYPLPHIRNKFIDIVSVFNENDTVKAEVFVDHRTYIVSNLNSVTAFASDSYSVCGDSVHISLSMELSIDKIDT